MDEKPAVKPNDWDTISDWVVPDSVATIFWIVFLGGPAVLAWTLWKWAKEAGGAKWWILRIGAVISGAFSATCFTLLFYAVSRKIGFLKAIVDPIVTGVPLIGGRLAGWLNTPILPTPKLWHLIVLVTIVVAASVLIWRARRNRVTAAEPPPLPEPSEPPAEVPPAQPLQTEAPDEAPRPIADTPPPEAPQVRTCKLFNLTWRKNASGQWQPLCPRCSRPMGVVDQQREGSYIATGGAPRISVAVCSIPGCNQHQQPLMIRAAQVQARLDSECPG